MTIHDTPEARTIQGVPIVAAPRIGRMIPLGEALKMMLTSQPISGRRAYDVGLVQEIAPDRESMQQAAEKLAGVPADRIEVLADRVLLYVGNGDEALAAVRAHGLEPVTSLVRRSTLEDVFLRLTGRRLEDG